MDKFDKFEELHLRLNRPASGGRDTVMARTPATCVQVAYHAGCHASRRAGFARRRSRPAGLVDLPAFGGNSSNECKRKRPPEETWSIATPMEDVSPVSDYDTGDEDDIVMTQEQEALYDIKNELFNLSCEFALQKQEVSRCKLHEEEAVAHAASLWRHEHSELQREKERVIKMQSDVQESVLQRQLEESALSLLVSQSRSLQKEVNDLEKNTWRRNSVFPFCSNKQGNLRQPYKEKNQVSATGDRNVWRLSQRCNRRRLTGRGCSRTLCLQRLI